MKRREALRPSAEMNLTNLIDTVFCILIVFMISAPLMSQGVKVDLPKTQSASLDEKKSVNITITREREILINELPTSPREFRGDFRKFWTGDDQTVVVVNADRNVPYGFVMALVADAQLEGARKLGFLTEPALTAGARR